MLLGARQELGVEGRADRAWGGMRDERWREELCLRAGGDGKGKQ